MSLTVRLNKTGNPSPFPFDFGTHTPFVSIRHTPVWSEDDPPRQVAVDKEWTIEGMIYGTETSVATAWAALKTALETPTNLPDGLQLLRGPSVVDEISQATGHSRFMIEELSTRKHDREWRGYLPFAAKVSARKRFPQGNGVVNLTQVESWSYAESGLLTHTLTGELETDTNTSSVALARKLGLTKPGPTFAFTTAGPEGVDVEQLNVADTKAKFTSTLQESGRALPAGVGPGYSREIEVARSTGEIKTTKSVSAAGPNAGAAVAAEGLTQGLVARSVKSDAHGWTASATWVTVSQEDSVLLRVLEFTIKGGGRPIAWTRMTGGLPPIRHDMPLEPVTITETCRIEALGDAVVTDFKFPKPLSGGGIVEDVSLGGFEPYPTLVSRGVNRSGDKWTGTLKRVYAAPTLKGVADAVKAALFSPELSVSPSAELARRDAASAGGSTK